MTMETLLMNSAEFDALVKSIKLSEDFMPRAISRDFAFSVDELLEKFCPYWKLGKPVLRIAKIFTPAKVDKAIDEFIVICDRLCKEPPGPEVSTLLEKFAMKWPVVKPVLEGVKAFTGPKADKIIDELIKIGDLLCVVNP
jgi:hypothetical protein